MSFIMVHDSTVQNKSQSGSVTIYHDTTPYMHNATKLNMEAQDIWHLLSCFIIWFIS